MSSMTSLERHVGALISAYADRAPTVVDPLAMTQLAAGGRTRAPRVWQFVAPRRGFALLLLVVALLAAVAASSLLVGAQLVRRDPDAVLGTHFGRGSYVYVYGDGRVIVKPDGVIVKNTWMGTVGERRLTQEGVELVRSGSLDPAWFNPAVVLQAGKAVPADVWADREFHLYRPSSYAICYSIGDVEAEPTSVVDLLPAPLQGIVRGKERVFDVVAVNNMNYPPEVAVRTSACSELTVEEDRALQEALNRAGASRHPPPLEQFDTWTVYGTSNRATSPVEIEVVRHPLLPHGGWVFHYPLSGPHGRTRSS